MYYHLQANYGGISCPLPKQLQNMFGEEEEATDELEADNDEIMEIENSYEVEMNWNICRYLPEEGSCQEIFKVIVAGHIQALYSHLLEVQRECEPGQTPVQRRTGSSQTQQVYIKHTHITIAL